MPYLLSDSTFRQLQALISERQSAALPVYGPRTPADLASDPFMPFDLFFHRASGTFRVYLPAGCCVMGGRVVAIDTSALTAIAGQSDWYGFTAPSSDGDLYAVAKAASEDAEPLLTISLADASTPALAAGGMARLIARVSLPASGVWRVRQLSRGSVNGGSMPDSLSAGQSSLGLTDVDGYPVWQIDAFDADDTVASGLIELLKADPESGDITVQGGEQYELLVRVKSSDGSVRAVGYMPLGESDGTDPSGTGGSSADLCQHAGPPGGGGGGDGTTGPDSHNPFPDADKGDSTLDNRGEFPAKTGPCW